MTLRIGGWRKPRPRNYCCYILMVGNPLKHNATVCGNTGTQDFWGLLCSSSLYHWVMSSDTKGYHLKWGLWLFGCWSFSSCITDWEVPCYKQNHLVPRMLLVTNAQQARCADSRCCLPFYKSTTGIVVGRTTLARLILCLTHDKNCLMMGLSSPTNPASPA